MPEVRPTLASAAQDTPTLRCDPLFWLALFAGPLCWLLLFLLLRPAPPRWSWPLESPAGYLLPVLVYPVLEEIIFRGLLQELVQEYLSRRALGPFSLANLIISLVFTGFHFLNHTPVWAALVFLPSLVFGFFKDRHGTLTAPILLHAFYNAGFLLIFTAPV
jgi:membrane protease YdiL (CAAX protease family)